MKTRSYITAILLMIILQMSMEVHGQSKEPNNGFTLSASDSFKILGYYASFGVTLAPPQLMDYSALTHVIHFNINPSTTAPFFGPVVSSAESLNIEFANTYAGNNNTHVQRILIDSSHAHGGKVILGIAATMYNSSAYAAMDYITQDSTRCQTFVNSYVTYLQRKGYDGVDINWEFPSSSQKTNYMRMMRLFRRALNSMGSYSGKMLGNNGRGILTQTSYPYNRPLSVDQWFIASELDTLIDFVMPEMYTLGVGQMNSRQGYGCALYDPDGSAITYDAHVLAESTYQGGYAGPIGIANMGINRKRIAPGLGFEKYLYKNVTGVGQTPGTAADGGNFHYMMVENPTIGYGLKPEYWDDAAKVHYKTWNDAGTNYFLSYEDSTSLAIKVAWIKQQGFGGVMLYALNEGYISAVNAYGGMPSYSGDRQKLLHSVAKAAWGTSTPPPPTDTTPPTVSLQSPTNGATISNTVTVSANASDNVGVIGVQFKLDGSNLGVEDQSSPFSISWNTTITSNGAHTLTATARDAAGLASTATISVTVSNVVPPADTIAPTVSVTSPSNGATVSNTITLSADAADNVGVLGVQFAVDGTPVGGELTSAPYSMSWNTAGVSNGSHTVTAEARDAVGLRATASVSITISNSIPPGSGTDEWVYQENSLYSPWINTSWNSTNTYNSTEQAHSGITSTKLVQGAWGALRAHSGSWALPATIYPSQYSDFEFAVFAPASGLSLAVKFYNDTNDSFPSVVYNNVPSGRWVMISFPINELDPVGHVIHQFSIQNYTTGTQTFYVDNIRLAGLGKANYFLSPQLLDFGKVGLGFAKDDSLYLTNVSTDPISFTNIRTSSDKFVVNSAAITVPGNTTSKLYVTFSPDQKITFNGSIILDRSGSGTSDTIQITGKGVSPPRLRRSPSRMSFHVLPPGYSEVDSLLIHNDGEADLTISNIRATSPKIVVSPSTTSVAPADSQWIRVTVTPNSTDPESAYIIVTHNASANPDSIRIDLNLSTSVDEGNLQPERFILYNNYPNPFNPATTISYFLPADARVSLTVFNPLGEKIKSIVNETQSAGLKSYVWNATDNLGRAVASGVYFTRVEVSQSTGKTIFTRVSRMLLVK